MNFKTVLDDKPEDGLVAHINCYVNKLSFFLVNFVYCTLIYFNRIRTKKFVNFVNGLLLSDRQALDIRKTLT